jgi:hypothetical protein
MPFLSRFLAGGVFLFFEMKMRNIDRVCIVGITNRGAGNIFSIVKK